jgi:transcriptional regulator with XRE-family HTH domain
MITLSQRIEQLRTQAGVSRPALAAALGFPKGAVEKFETGRQTPTREQQQKLADHFGVSLFYLRGESNDPTRQGDWMDQITALDEGEGHVPTPAPQKPTPTPQRPAGEGTLLEAMLAGKQAQGALRTAVLEVLRSPEGQALIAQAVRRELGR